MSKIKDFFVLIDFEFTLFGLPFAYLGAFLAANGLPTLEQLGWITLAMIAARTAALCLNRVIDLPYDKANPRSQDWVLVRGRLKVSSVWVITAISIFLLVFAAANLNRLCLYLSPIAVFLLWGYSYTKRFTWLCHLILGLVIGIGPIGSFLAVTGSWDFRPLAFWLAIGFWVGGLDILYACQDIAFDREQGLYSIPARFGETNALRISALFHLLTVVLFVVGGLVFDLGFWYYTGIVFASVVLLWEHILVGPGRLEMVDAAAFKLNRYVSLVIFVMTIIELLGR